MSRGTRRGRGPRWLVLAGLAVAAAGSAAAPADARAGTFTHVICAHPETRVGTGLSTVEGLSDLGGGTGWQTTWDCPSNLLGSFSGIVLKRAGGSGAAPGSWRGLLYAVDRPGLRLDRATLWRVISSSNGTTGEVRWGQHAATDLADPHAAPAHTTEWGTWTTGYLSKGTNNSTQLFSATNRVEPVIADDAFAVSAACASPATACSGSMNYYVFGATAVIADDAAPELRSASGSLAEADRLAGAPSARLELADEGAGLHRLELALDGDVVRTVDLGADDPHCRDVHPGNADPREFAYQTPCPSARELDVALPVYEAADGEHRLTMTVEDAAGNRTAVTDRAVEVDNHPAPVPVADEPPVVHGDPEPGTTLTASSGAWLRASSLTYRWERCTADGCSPIPGAGARTYVTAADDFGAELRVVVTAANAIGEETSAASEPIAVAAAPPAQSTPADPVEQTDEPTSDEKPQAPPSGTGLATPQVLPQAPSLPLTATTIRPLAVLPAVRSAARPNGRRATPQARITIRLSRGGRVIRGRLLTAAGRPIAGARVELASSCLGRGHPRCRAWVVTRTDGTFTYRPAMRPTRLVSAAYRHDLTRTAAATRATLRIRPAGSSLRLQPSVGRIGVRRRSA